MNRSHFSCALVSCVLVSSALASLLAPVPSFAQPWLSNEDCDVLAKAVRQHVWLAATEAKLDQSEPPVATLAIGATDRLVCRRTVETTTRAFRESLGTFNLSIGWEPPNPGDYCLSGDLSQCYPEVGPFPRIPATRMAFVYEAWHGVRDAVQSLMPHGATGGVAVFSASSLDAALSARLRQSVQAPLHARLATP